MDQSLQMEQISIRVHPREGNKTHSKDQVIGTTPVEGSAIALNAPIERSSELRFLHLIPPPRQSHSKVRRGETDPGQASATVALTVFPFDVFLIVTVRPQSGAWFDPLPYCDSKRVHQFLISSSQPLDSLDQSEAQRSYLFVSVSLKVQKVGECSLVRIGVHFPTGSRPSLLIEERRKPITERSIQTNPHTQRRSRERD